MHNPQLHIKAIFFGVMKTLSVSLSYCASNRLYAFCCNKKLLKGVLEMNIILMNQQPNKYLQYP